MKCQFVAEIVRSFPGITLNELRGLVDGNDEEFKKLIRPVRHLILDTGEPGIDLTERQQNVITALQAAAAIASPLSANKYDELIRSGKVDGPGKQLLQSSSDHGVKPVRLQESPLTVQAVTTTSESGAMT